MSKETRLSEASSQVTAALATLDGAALTELTERLSSIAEEVAAGRPGVVPERAEAVERELRILGEVLVSTEENIYLLRRLQQRKARQEWVL
jgi:hypothetical protein